MGKIYSCAIHWSDLGKSILLGNLGESTCVCAIYLGDFGKSIAVLNARKRPARLALPIFAKYLANIIANDYQAMVSRSCGCASYVRASLLMPML